MKYNPHNYQQFAKDFIEENPACAVFLDMGLGKTAITLTAINDLLFDSFVAHRVLVIAPLRVARDTWPDELAKWDHLSGLIFSVAVGTASERKAALARAADIYIINRENVQWLIDTMVVDELSSFKSHQSKRFKSLMKMRPMVKRIVGLTGTPSSNGLIDLWAQFRLLDMGQRLGRFIGQYRTSYFTPDKRNAQVIFSYKLLPGAEEQIYERIGDITISMKSADHLVMPELVSAERIVRLSGKERGRYDELKDDLVLSLEGGEITAANAAALSGKLCQMANGAVYGDDGKVHHIHDRKLDALEDLIEAANGKPVLVAYWFKHDLKRITERLTKLKVPFSRLDDADDIKKWNRGELPIALIHPASAGHGLNLQSGGSAIIWFGLTWSLELYQQANARLWRQGQESETVVLHHIISEGTIDERVMKALAGKDKTQTALIEAVKANL
ncbi:DEAD/DEAH box helicase [Clostridia bacterium]|nr:DEAD/DEAH box helicase [Clostridia bacterium]